MVLSSHGRAGTSEGTLQESGRALSTIHPQLCSHIIGPTQRSLLSNRPAGELTVGPFRPRCTSDAQAAAAKISIGAPTVTRNSLPYHCTYDLDITHPLLDEIVLEGCSSLLRSVRSSSQSSPRRSILRCTADLLLAQSLCQRAVTQTPRFFVPVHARVSAPRCLPKARELGPDEYQSRRSF